MVENTKIEWASHTFNPWLGCTKVSTGCANCYAETLMDTRHGRVEWGQNGTRSKTSEANWNEPLKWNREAEKNGSRPRVFCASLADVFEDWHGPILDHHGNQLNIHNDTGEITTEAHFEPLTMDGLRWDLFRLIEKTPYLDWLVVTKRPENVLRMVRQGMKDSDHCCGRCGRGDCDSTPCFPNLWLLTSVENQETADTRIPELLKCRGLAAVLGLSCEPLLGPIDLGFSNATCKCCDSPDSRWIHLPDKVHGDGPFSARNAGAGFYRASSNKHGAFSVLANDGKLLGIRPREMRNLGCVDWVIAGGESGNPSRPMHPDWARRLVDWVIAGGESGNPSRPMHPDWARRLRDQCQTAGVPFFFKQWGDHLPIEDAEQPEAVPTKILVGTPSETTVMKPPGRKIVLVKTDGGNRIFNSNGTFTGEAPQQADAWMARVGKKKAGRLLDGREWNEFPSVSQ